jgi:Pin2-interacting protein X1
VRSCAVSRSCAYINLSYSARNKYIKSKRLASQSPAAMAEILGIPMSALPSSGASTPVPTLHKAHINTSSALSGEPINADSGSSTPNSVESPPDDGRAEHMLTTSTLSVYEYFRRKLAQKKAEREGLPVPEMSYAAEGYNEVAKDFEGKKIKFEMEDEDEDGDDAPINSGIGSTLPAEEPTAASTPVTAPQTKEERKASQKAIKEAEKAAKKAAKAAKKQQAEGSGSGVSKKEKKRKRDDSDAETETKSSKGKERATDQVDQADAAVAVAKKAKKEKRDSKNKLREAAATTTSTEQVEVTSAKGHKVKKEKRKDVSDMSDLRIRPWADIQNRSLDEMSTRLLWLLRRSRTCS